VAYVCENWVLNRSEGGGGRGEIETAEMRFLRRYSGCACTQCGSVQCITNTSSRFRRRSQNYKTMWHKHIATRLAQKVKNYRPDGRRLACRQRRRGEETERAKKKEGCLEVDGGAYDDIAVNGGHLCPPPATPDSACFLPLQ
jgi:hypothetical protein